VLIRPLFWGTSSACADDRSPDEKNRSVSRGRDFAHAQSQPDFVDQLTHFVRSPIPPKSVQNANCLSVQEGFLPSNLQSLMGRGNELIPLPLPIQIIRKGRGILLMGVVDELTERQADFSAAGGYPISCVTPNSDHAT
jgi:hypothetical protein